MKQQVCVAAISFSMVFTSLRSHAADPLVPPGPPGSEEATMKTLNEIEPRHLISSLPYVITNSGSYYVTGNLLGSTNLSGITIQSSQVQVDMNGFTRSARQIRAGE